MAHHEATILWNREGALFTDKRYSRGHRWVFDGGTEVPASSSPQVVRLPFSVEAAVDPEEAFIASLSSCHMLWFLDIACRQGYVVESYRDQAIGIMARDTNSKLAMTKVTLHPEVQFTGEKQPTAEDILAMHHEAHDECFIANSVKTEIICEPIGLPV